jgi:hypothetical protein
MHLIIDSPKNTDTRLELKAKVMQLYNWISKIDLQHLPMLRQKTSP